MLAGNEVACTIGSLSLIVICVSDLVMPRIMYLISQNSRDLKISRIAAKTGVRNVREYKFREGDSTR